MSGRRVLLHADLPELAQAVAERLLLKLGELLASQPRVHICLTGGTAGIAVLAAVARRPERGGVDWDRVDFWWGDERYVPAGHPDRNEGQARAALLDALGAGRLHPLPALGEQPDIEAAARAAEAELAAHALPGDRFPRFDIAFLGLGPDGHVASLFPGHASVRETERTVVAETDSPKPPPERLSLTLPVINASERVWFVVSGADKAAALSLTLAGARAEEVPAAGVEGRGTTIFFVEAAAAVDVPESLIAPEEEWTNTHPSSG